MAASVFICRSPCGFWVGGKLVGSPFSSVWFPLDVYHSTNETLHKGKVGRVEGPIGEGIQ